MTVGIVSTPWAFLASRPTSPRPASRGRGHVASGVPCWICSRGPADADALGAGLRSLVAEAVRNEVGRTTPDSGKNAKLVTVSAYAAARSISPSTVRAAVREGRLQAHRIGRAVRIAVDSEIARPGSSDLRKARTLRALGVIKAGR